ncbi:MAG: pyruvoyl-dependent arginine decarboxylase [Candidatus Aureabacteria bacterium]|nr:pyruvoyl-dependent arginine decarboxylase [Candidatus Auribacterota bacterium]
MVPKKIFLTKGVGAHKHKLRSFEQALRMAGIQACNLVQVSSIFPPKCKLITRKVGLTCLKAGAIQHVVMARNETNEANRMIAASVGLSKPIKNNAYGYLSEYHSFGENAKIAGDYAEDLAASMLAETLGLTGFDADIAWDSRKELYKTTKGFFTSRNVTQTARGITGKWITVIAAAVLVI